MSLRLLTRNASRLLKVPIREVIRATGFEIVRKESASKVAAVSDLPVDFEPDHIRIFNRVQPYTLTSAERVFMLIEAVRYVVRRKIPGSIVECGVWKGGSMMAAALSLLDLNAGDRDLHLFDTFAGMPKPQEVDVDARGFAAAPVFKQEQLGEDSSDVCRAVLPDVQAAMATTGYDTKRIHYHVGKVENTIPAAAPDTIAILRLDTDWYESTRHELEHLYPRLSPGGILIVDDYGHWRGSRKATDEYLEKYEPSLFLNRIDYTGRIAVKPAQSQRGPL
jgi:O-methyltransferase